MSLGNDPARVPDVEEPEPVECSRCPRMTHAASGVCSDCRFEDQQSRGPSRGFLP